MSLSQRLKMKPIKSTYTEPYEKAKELGKQLYQEGAYTRTTPENVEQPVNQSVSTEIQPTSGFLGYSKPKLSERIKVDTDYLKEQSGDFEKSKTSEDIGNQLEQEFGYNPNHPLKTSFTRKMPKTDAEKTRYSQLLDEWQQSKFAEKPFTTGVISGANPLGEGYWDFIEKTGNKNLWGVEKAKESDLYGAGQVAGTVGKYASAYSTFGNLITGGEAASQLPTLQSAGASGLRQQLSQRLATGASGQFLGELAKDVAIGGTLGGVEAAASNKNVKEEVAKNVLFDAMTNAVLMGAGTALKSLRQLKTPQAVETVAKQLNIPTSEADEVIESVIKNTPQSEVDFYVNQFGTASKQPFEQLQLQAPKTMESSAIGSRLNISQDFTKPIPQKIKSELPISERTFKEIGNQKIKAFQFENPEVKPFYRDKANELLIDLNNTIKGERLYNWGDDLTITGTPRITSPVLADIKDSTGATYEQIKDSLNRLITDNGQENQALAKKIEVVIDDMLVNGYKRIDGIEVDPNIRYIQIRNSVDTTQIKIPELEYNTSSQLNEQLTFGALSEGEQQSIFDTQFQNAINSEIKNGDVIKPEVTAHPFIEDDLFDEQLKKANEAITKNLNKLKGKTYRITSNTTDNSVIIHPRGNEIQATVMDKNYTPLMDKRFNSYDDMVKSFTKDPLIDGELKITFEDAKPIEKFELLPEFSINKPKQPSLNLLRAKEVPRTVLPSEVSFKPELPKLKTISETAQPTKTTLELPKIDNIAPKEIPSVKNAYTLSEVITQAPKYKDVGTTERWTTDVYRQFEKVFGNDFKTVKKAVLDPFDAAKKARVEDEIKLTDSLKKDIVDKLGIKKGSEDSALVMRFGEGRISDGELVDKVGLDKAQKIIKADAWFRDQYDTLLNDINTNRIMGGLEPIPSRPDYYRHYLEMGDQIQALKNIFENTQLISPKLEGLSEFTKPKEKWMSIKQRYTGSGKFTEDAVGGFLDYIKAGTYAKHIDPQIQNFRNLRKDLANATEGTKNMNNFIGFLDEFANNLSGKTNKFDRTVQDLIGRQKFQAINWINSRMKSNAVLGNLSSSLSQIANVPQGIAYVKDPVILGDAMQGYFKSIGGGGDSDLYNQSGFLKERLTDSFSQFDQKILDQPKKLAQWLLGALDETGTKFIWSSTYRKGLKDGVKDPIKYADDVTRSLVAGRGIGEVPTLQQSKVFQLIAPFTLEVSNLWKVQKDFLKAKDFGGLAILYGANFLLNNAMEEIRGSGVVFDPIQAVIDGFQTEGTFGDKLIGTGGSLTGEALSNMPLGSSVASAYPEYGGKFGDIKLPTRKELFGENDPTRYGTGVPVVKAIQDPLKNLALPYGGSQISKTIQGAKTMGLLPQNILQNQQVGDKIEPTLTKQKLPASINASGKLRTFVEPTPSKIAQALAFGGYASKEVQNYFKDKGSVFGENQTANIMQLVNEGFEPLELGKALNEARQYTKKADRIELLRKKGYNEEEIKRIGKVYWGYSQ